MGELAPANKYEEATSKRNGKRISRPKCAGICVVLISIFCIASLTAQEPEKDQPYSGNFLKRSTFTGDWGGIRNEWAEKGVTFDFYVAQIEQGVTNGGKDSTWRYEGRGDFTLKMDTGKLGLWKGGSLNFEMEGNWGHAVNLSTGALMTVGTNHAFPVVGKTLFALPALNFTQFLSKHLGLFAGKLDTVITGDLNTFAHGKGDDQFMNLAFNINPVLIMTVPYSTLGAGAIVLPGENPESVVVSLAVVSTLGLASTSGFSDLSGNALTVSGEIRGLTKFFERTGHQMGGFTYSNNEFTHLDQRLGEYLETGQIAKKKNSWSLIYNFDQFISESSKEPGKGIGLFSRFGASDGNPNPANYFGSLGLGSKGVASRSNDGFGIAWYYLAVRSPTLATGTGIKQPLRNEQGAELYYTWAPAPWAQVTPNFQIVSPSQIATKDGRPIGTTAVFGARLRIAF